MELQVSFPSLKRCISVLHFWRRSSFLTTIIVASSTLGKKILRRWKALECTTSKLLVGLGRGGEWSCLTRRKMGLQKLERISCTSRAKLFLRITRQSWSFIISISLKKLTNIILSLLFQEIHTSWNYWRRQLRERRFVLFESQGTQTNWRQVQFFIMVVCNVYSLLFAWLTLLLIYIASSWSM